MVANGVKCLVLEKKTAPLFCGSWELSHTENLKETGLIFSDTYHYFREVIFCCCSLLFLTTIRASTNRAFYSSPFQNVFREYDAAADENELSRKPTYE